MLTQMWKGHCGRCGSGVAQGRNRALTAQMFPSQPSKELSLAEREANEDRTPIDFIRENKPTEGAGRSCLSRPAPGSQRERSDRSMALRLLGSGWGKTSLRSRERHGFA